MKLLPECYACTMRQTLSAARLVTEDEAFHHLCLREAALILTRARISSCPRDRATGRHSGGAAAGQS